MVVPERHTVRLGDLGVENGQVTLELSSWEKVGSLRRSDLVTSAAAIVSVQRLENARDGIRGIRAPGTGLPGTIALGTWRTRRTKDFVAVYRNDPGYLIVLTGAEFDRIVVSSPVVPELEELTA